MINVISSKKTRTYISDDELTNFVINNPGLSGMEIAIALDLSRTPTFRILGKLVNSGALYKVKSGQSVSYMSTESSIKKYSSLPNTAVEKPVIEEPVIEEPTAKEPVFEEVVEHPTFLPETSYSSAVNTGIESLITQIAHNITANMLDQIKQALLAGLEDLAIEVMPKVNRITTHATKEVKVKKVKVLVTGLLSHQAGMISSEFHECFDLDFWNDRTGGSKEQLRTAAKKADIILYHKNHAAHDHYELIKSVGGNIKIVNGGLSTMRETLTQMYINGINA
jgi:hypothetical protein